MFEGRDNWIGIMLLVACGLSAGAMLGYIDAGEVARFEGPAWQRYLIGGGGMVLIGALILLSLRGGRLGNDVRSPRRWWRRNTDDSAGDRKL